MSARQVPSSTLAIQKIAEWAERHELDFREGSRSSGAVLSRCGRYRYLLWRRAVGPWPFQAFAMLNPSTADASSDDPTIRRCTGFTPQGHSGPLVWNLFALRATDPADLRTGPDPVGPLNDAAIDLALSLSARTIAAWGAQGSYLRRDNEVLRRCAVAGATLHTLKLTAAGMPGHPLYLPKAATAEVWDYEW